MRISDWSSDVCSSDLITFLVGLVVGGVGSIPGAVFGGLFVLFLPNVSESIAGDVKGLTWAIYGAMLILVIYVMPSGAAGLVRLAAYRLVRRDRKSTRLNSSH